MISSRTLRRPLWLGLAILATAELALRVEHLGLSRAVLGRWREPPAWASVRTLDASGTPWPVPSGRASWSLAPGQPAVEYHLDPFGFRVAGEVAESATRVACRVLVVGDGLAFGYGLAAQEAFPAQLEEQLLADGGAARVFNAGVCASSVAQHRRRVEITVRDVAPDVVVLAESPWSLRLDPTPPQRAPAGIGDRLWRHVELRLRRAELWSALIERTSRRSLHLSSALLGWPPPSGVAWELIPLLETTEAFDRRWRDAARELSASVTIARRHGAEPILAFLPLDVQVSMESNRVYRDERLPYAAYGFEDRDYTRDDRYEQRLTGLAHELDTPFEDTAPALRALGTKAFLRDDYHLSAQGHRAVATALRDPVGRACTRASTVSGVHP